MSKKDQNGYSVDADDNCNSDEGWNPDVNQENRLPEEDTMEKFSLIISIQEDKLEKTIKFLESLIGRFPELVPIFETSVEYLRNMRDKLRMIIVKLETERVLTECSFQASTGGSGANAVEGEQTLGATSAHCTVDSDAVEGEQTLGATSAHCTVDSDARAVYCSYCSFKKFYQDKRCEKCSYVYCSNSQCKGSKEEAHRKVCDALVVDITEADNKDLDASYRSFLLRDLQWPYCLNKVFGHKALENVNRRLRFIAPHSVLANDTSSPVKMGGQSEAASANIDDMVTDDMVTDDIITDDIITDDIITDDIVTDDIVTDDIVTDDIVTDHIVTESVIEELCGLEIFDASRYVEDWTAHFHDPSDPLEVILNDLEYESRKKTHSYQRLIQLKEQSCASLLLQPNMDTSKRLRFLHCAATFCRKLKHYSESLTYYTRLHEQCFQNPARRPDGKAVEIAFYKAMAFAGLGMRIRAQAQADEGLQAADEVYRRTDSDRLEEFQQLYRIIMDMLSTLETADDFFLDTAFLNE